MNNNIYQDPYITVPYIVVTKTPGGHWRGFKIDAFNAAAALSIYVNSRMNYQPGRDNNFPVLVISATNGGVFTVKSETEPRFWL